MKRHLPRAREQAQHLERWFEDLTLPLANGRFRHAEHKCDVCLLLIARESLASDQLACCTTHAPDSALLFIPRQARTGLEVA